MPERPLLVLPKPGQPVARVKRRGFPSQHQTPNPRKTGRAANAPIRGAAASIRRASCPLPDGCPRFGSGRRGGSGDCRCQWSVSCRPSRGFPAWSGWRKSRMWTSRQTTTSLLGTMPEKERTGPLSGRLFMVFANQAALDQMLSLWRSWQGGRSLARGLGPWATLFAQLRDVRRWGVQDRLHETGVLDDWRERVEHGEETVPCELELWHRGSEATRNGHETVSVAWSRTMRRDSR